MPGSTPIYDLPWWNWVWVTATATSTLLLAAKVAAYLGELRWQQRMAPTIRWEWAHRQPNQPISVEMSYLNLQRHLLRPEPVFRQIRAVFKRPNVAFVLGVFWRSPVIVLIASVSMTLAGDAPPWLLDVAASVVSIAAAVMLLSALFGRLLLGPLDTLNTDLQPRGGLGSFHVADVTHLRLAYYFAVLIFIAITAGAGASAAVANAHASSFSGIDLRSAMSHERVIDPIPYLYFSVATIATVGYGDIVPKSDLARLLTIIHIATGPLLFSWLVAVFTQTTSRSVTAWAADTSWAYQAPRTECRHHDASSCPWRTANPLGAVEPLDDVI
jgi:hypothetical protein